MIKIKYIRYFILALFLSWVMSSPSFAFHPLSTDDPGTTEFRHFEMEWGNDMVWPDDSMEEFSGYLALKGGLAPGLEFDAAVNFFYSIDIGDGYTSGWGDSEMLLKYRFFGDGDGPFNMGIEGIASFPSGEADKGLSGGDNIIPTVFLFGTVGHGPIRIMLNAGVTFVPEDNETMLYGAAIEWSVAEKWQLVAEIFGESDFDEGGGDDPLEGLIGACFAPADWLTLSAGAGFGMAPDSPDYHLTFAALVGW